MSPIRAQFLGNALGVPVPGASGLSQQAVLGAVGAGPAPAPAPAPAAPQAPEQQGSVIEGSGFNPLAAGRKHYGGGRPHPNQGKTSDIGGYGARDARREVQMSALKRRAGGV